jgi:hypothetical protein
MKTLLWLSVTVIWYIMKTLLGDFQKNEEFVW